MHLLVATLAGDVERERERARRDPANHVAHAWAHPAHRSPMSGRIRHGAARSFARISLVSAALVRRLDARIADDLGGPLVPCDGG
jgi:hypothetical protein